MIGYLYGQVVYKKPPVLILDVHGVGYELLVSMNTFYHLKDNQSAIRLYTQLVVREDAHTLYGFGDLEERTLFRALLRVNGVGPKLALNILSSLTPKMFIQQVHQSDVVALIKLPGVGKKMAERLVLEMQDILKQLDTHLGQMHGPSRLSESTPWAYQAQSDAVAGLLSLGYKLADANRVVANIEAQEQSSETILRQALQQLLNQ